MTPGGAGLVMLLLLATLGEGGAAAGSMLLWHGLLVALLIHSVQRSANSRRRLPAGAWRAFGVFVLLACLGALRAPYTYGAWLTLLELGAFTATMLLAARVGGAPWLDAALWPLRLGAAAQSCYVLAQRWWLDVPRPAGTFLNTNHLSGWLVAILLLSLAAGMRESGAGRRGLALLLGLPVLGAILASGSRAAMGGLLLGGGWLIWSHWRRLDRRLRLGLVAIAVVTVGGVGVRQVQRLGDTDPFNFHRVKIWKACAAGITERPWWGSGPGQFSALAAGYQFPDGDPPLDYDRTFHATHSDPLRAVAELGLPAAIALLVAAALGVSSLRGRSHDPGVIAALLAVGLQALVDNPSRWPALYLLVAALLGNLLARQGTEQRVAGWQWRLASVVVLLVVFVTGDLRPTVAHLRFARLPGEGALDAEQSRRLAAALAENPIHPLYWSRLAQARLLAEDPPSLDDYAAARHAAERAVALQPASARYRWQLARLEAHAWSTLFGDVDTWERALGHYEAAAALAPHDARLPIEAGRLALAAGQGTRARRLAEQALAIESNAAPAHLLLAESLLDGGGARKTVERHLAEALRIASEHDRLARRDPYAAQLLTLDRARVSRLRQRLDSDVAEDG